MASRAGRLASILVLLAALAGCNTMPTNSAGVAPVDVNPQVGSPIRGVGIEGRDIISMSDQMMRDMLASRRLMQRNRDGHAPRVIVDAGAFTNDSSQPINRNIITDRLRVSLNRAADGRLTLVGRQYAAAVESERQLKRTGVTDVGTKGMTKGTLGADFRLGGRITTLDQRSQRTGMIGRYTQITFELFDLETSEIVWTNVYEMERTASDDVMYR